MGRKPKIPTEVNLAQCHQPSCPPHLPLFTGKAEVVFGGLLLEQRVGIVQSVGVAKEVVALQHSRRATVETDTVRTLVSLHLVGLDEQFIGEGVLTAFRRVGGRSNWLQAKAGDVLENEVA
jgi:hypothetical protein